MSTQTVNISTIDINYTRVFPRDFFNEAKLLKCFGVLALKIHDRLAPEGLELHENVTCEEFESGYDEGFKIGLMDEGYLTIANISISAHGVPLLFCTNYNSKDNFPFFVYHEYTEIYVFDEQGDFQEEFIGFIQSLKK